MSETYFDSREFLDLLTALVVKDRGFLKQCSHLLTPKDFRMSQKGSGEQARRIVAQLALEHFEKYRAPIRDLLEAEVIDHCRRSRLDGRRKQELLEYARHAVRRKVRATSSITDKVIQFKQEAAKANAVKQLIDLQASGRLTDDRWLEICHDAIKTFSADQFKSSDYFEELEERMDRRTFSGDTRFPVLFIEPFDRKVRAIARGHLGLVIAPYKRGKSLMLLWIALAYTLQKLNVLFITLEDPKVDVEDRFDACVSALPVKKLGHMRRTLKERFLRFKRLVKSHLKIVDGTDTTMTVQMIETIYEQERDRGFDADAVMVDYDDELVAAKKSDERRFELADIYRQLRRFAAKRDLFLWTAAQTKRGTSGLRELGGDHLAEDVSKARKVAFAMSLGKGDWGEGSVYLYVAAHKFDRMHIGCNIMSDLDRMLIYDRDKTRECEHNPPEVNGDHVEKKYV